MGHAAPMSFLTHRRWGAGDVPDQTGRIALVTGANSGLGLQTALGLARAGSRVLMTSRSPERGEAALRRVREQVPGARAELVSLDLSSLASVQEAAGGAPKNHLLAR